MPDSSHIETRGQGSLSAQRVWTQGVVRSAPEHSLTIIIAVPTTMSSAQCIPVRSVRRGGRIITIPKGLQETRPPEIRGLKEDNTRREQEQRGGGMYSAVECAASAQVCSLRVVARPASTTIGRSETARRGWEISISMICSVSPTHLHLPL
jgi:hypothetical protein